MTTAPGIPSDWPESLSPSVVSPAAYLRTQAANLAEVSKGVLQARVATTVNGREVTLALLVFAPGVDYVATLLEATHDVDNPYPVTVESQAEYTPPAGMVRDDGPVRAMTYEDFRAVVRLILNSRESVSLLQSLLARKSDALFAQAG